MSVKLCGMSVSEGDELFGCFCISVHFPKYICLAILSFTEEKEVSQL